MKNRKINGIQLENMLKNGLANLRSREIEVNKLNVFPVADGDTGTNMCATLENGINFAKTKPEVCFYLKTLSEGMLLGARGNSGVILSQFFKGVYTELSRAAFAGPGELRNALIRGYRTAYESVVKPVEGTILTVTREGIEHIKTQITRNITIEELLSMYIGEMKKTLSYTPEMLPVLKESGVVDSGAYGFIIIVEGMLKFLYGEIIETEPGHTTQTAASGSAPDFSLFNENSVFEDGYCMEFILQLLNSSGYTRHFRIDRFIEDIQVYGNSLVVVQDNKRVKVHIHTKKPEKVITLARDYGEFLTFKLENMQLQHNEVIKQSIQKKPHKAVSIVSVVNGSGLKELFEELGSDAVICCPDTMNASTQEFIDAFNRVDADDIVVLPNNKNVILAAEQAVKLHGAKNIHVLPTKSVAEGYFALAMDVPDGENSFRISSMKSGIGGITTVSQTTASRDYSYHELSCRAGEDIVFINEKLSCVSTDWCEGILSALKMVDGIDEKETCVVFYGEGVSNEQISLLECRLQESFPLLEADFIKGDQKVYRWIIGLA